MQYSKNIFLILNKKVVKLLILQILNDKNKQ